MAPSSPDFPLLPLRATFRPEDDVLVETGVGGRLRVTHLGDEVAGLTAPPGVLNLGQLPAGGYGLELFSHGATHRSAVEVTPHPGASMRYGFVASYRPGRDPEGLARLARRLHLTDIQFYDWAYRHADLLGGGEVYDDPLGQPISLQTVRTLIDALHDVGSRALGYAAVYGVGNEEWSQWSDLALVRPDGSPEQLGGFLQLVDPGEPRWLAHFTEDLQAATNLGFDGFHLDQYGYPRMGYGRAGAVDLAESFATMIAACRKALPTSRLVFNNVNDFPTRRTACAPQDALYVEVWKPNVEYRDLADIITRARAADAAKPIVLAAYQSVYSSAPREAADATTRFTLATVLSHGATQLLAGEDGALLVDPYYVRNHPAAPETLDLLQRWYDFAVAHGELLMDPAISDVSASWLGDLNDAVTVDFPGAPSGIHPADGVWTRLTQIEPGRLVLHLINLTGQPDLEWDAPKTYPAATGSGRLRVRRTGPRIPRVRVADPDGTGVLADVEGTLDGEHAVFTLPEPCTWQLVTIGL